MNSHPSDLVASLEQISRGEVSRVDLRFGYPIPKVCFTHIHKTGGGTVERILRQFYAPDEFRSEEKGHISDGEMGSVETLLAEDRIRFLYGHRDRTDLVDSTWALITFTRNPKDRLRSHLPSVLGAIDSLSPSPEADRTALSRGGLPELLGRDDEFSSTLGWKSLNLLAREFLLAQYMAVKGGSLKHVKRKAFDIHAQHLAAFGKDGLRRKTEEHLKPYVFVGCLELLKLSVAMMMWKLGLPAQRSIAHIHRGGAAKREQARQIVDSIPEDGLERLIGLDRVVDGVLRQRFESERDTFHAAMSEEGEGDATDFVACSFERRFREHVAGRADQALRAFRLEPGDPVLGWGFGNMRLENGLKRAHWRLDEGSGCGFYLHMQPHSHGSIFVLCDISLAPREGRTRLTVRMNGADCDCRQVVRSGDPSQDRRLAWIEFGYASAAPLEETAIRVVELMIPLISVEKSHRVYAVAGLAGSLQAPLPPLQDGKG